MKKTTVILALMFGGLFSQPIMAQNPLHGAWEMCIKMDYYDLEYIVIFEPNGKETEIENYYIRGSHCREDDHLFSVAREWSYFESKDYFHSTRTKSKMISFEERGVVVLNILQPCGIKDWKLEEVVNCDYSEDQFSDKTVGQQTSTKYELVLPQVMKFYGSSGENFLYLWNNKKRYEDWTKK